jgi:hypothetical protein
MAFVDVIRLTNVSLPVECPCSRARYYSPFTLGLFIPKLGAYEFITIPQRHLQLSGKVSSIITQRVHNSDCLLTCFSALNGFVLTR